MQAGILLKTNGRHIQPQGVGRFFKRCPAHGNGIIKIFSHALPLGTLPRKNSRRSFGFTHTFSLQICDQNLCVPASDSGC